MFAVNAFAAADIDSDKKYHIVCQLYSGGCVADGSSAGQSTPLYYYTTSNNNDETYWIFTEESAGKYSIKNSKTGYYITYDGVRSDYRRYVSMTADKDGNNSLWTLNQYSDGYYAIRNVANTNQLWDVRSGSYMVGTYDNSGTPNSNQVFAVYDSDGVQVTEKSSSRSSEGIDVSSWMTGDMSSLDGWDYRHFFMNTGAGGSHYNGDASLVAPFIEYWLSYQELNDAYLTQTLENLPDGEYSITADMISCWQYSSWYGKEDADGVTLFANDVSTSISTKNNVPETFTVNVSLSGGQLKWGVNISSTNANWVAIDNPSIYFKGSWEELLEGEKAKLKAELIYYYSSDSIASLISQIMTDNITNVQKFNKMETLRKSTADLPVIDPITLCLKNLKINDKTLIYDQRNDIYMYSIPSSEFGNDYKVTVSYENNDGWGNLYIDNTEVKSGQSYTFGYVKGSKTYSLSCKNIEGTEVKRNITFTSLPVIQLYGTYGYTDAYGSMKVYEPEKGQPETMALRAKWRGGITNNADKHKRNYRIKFLDDNGNKIDRKFFNLRSDNTWILEACQVDMSRVRNRVVTDLWNDFASKPYYINEAPKALTGTRGHFVELLINDKYEGIYCMYENLDRKQMKLEKYDEDTKNIAGMLWKAKEWSYSVFMGHDRDNNYYPGTAPTDYNQYSDMWDQYQLKYPDIEDVSPTDWSVLWDAVNFVCTSSDSDFANNVASYFDLPVVMDYYILMETILSADNHGKNMFWAVYNKQRSKKITPAVWDLDATIGQRWSDYYYHDNVLRPEQDYADFITYNEHGDFNLFRRLRNTDANDFNMQVRLRYRDLRENYLKTENLIQRFADYLDEFKQAGADERESARWSYDSDVSGLEINFDTEMEYIKDWLTKRMNYLDNTRFKISELPSGINGVINNDVIHDGYYYNLQGVKVGNTYEDLPSGIYIINGKKIIK